MKPASPHLVSGVRVASVFSPEAKKIPLRELFYSLQNIHSGDDDPFRSLHIEDLRSFIKLSSSQYSLAIVDGVEWVSISKNSNFSDLWLASAVHEQLYKLASEIVSCAISGRACAKVLERRNGEFFMARSTMNCYFRTHKNRLEEQATKAVPLKQPLTAIASEFVANMYFCLPSVATVLATVVRDTPNAELDSLRVNENALARCIIGTIGSLVSSQGATADAGEDQLRDEDLEAVEEQEQCVQEGAKVERATTAAKDEHPPPAQSSSSLPVLTPEAIVPIVPPESLSGETKAEEKSVATEISLQPVHSFTSPAVTCLLSPTTATAPAVSASTVSVVTTPTIEQEDIDSKDDDEEEEVPSTRSASSANTKSLSVTVNAHSEPPPCYTISKFIQNHMNKFVQPMPAHLARALTTALWQNSMTITKLRHQKDLMAGFKLVYGRTSPPVLYHALVRNPQLVSVLVNYSQPGASIVSLNPSFYAIDPPAAPASMQRSTYQKPPGNPIPVVSPSPILRTVIDDIAGCTSAMRDLASSKVLAVDCEGANLGRFGAPSLVQIAGSSCAIVFLFDLHSGTSRVDISNALKQLLEDASRMKLLHDCRADCDALFFHLGIRMVNVIDTQVFHGLLSQLEKVTPTGAVAPLTGLPRTGLNKLLTIANLSLNPLKEEIGRAMESDPNFWLKRPLSSRMIEYAASDVTQLIALEKWLRDRCGETLLAAVRKLSESQTTLPLSATPASSSAAVVSRPPLNTLCLLRISHETNEPSYEIVREEIAETILESLSSRSEKTLSENTELPSLLRILPQPLQTILKTTFASRLSSLIEILLSQFRAPVLRFDDDTEEDLLSIDPEELLANALELLLAGKPLERIFSIDNRAGMPGALHRISATRDRAGNVIALTYRVGRHVPGTAELVRDLVALVGAKQSMLLLGPPGVGKTTLLRDVSRLLSSELRRRVVVVDTSNEIAGDHPRPHECIGRAHRMPVPDRRRQHEVLIEAVQNQNPQVIIVDEIGTAEEVAAALTITQRGVGLVGTAHGITIHSVLKNPTLRKLVGDVKSVTLSANEALMRATGSASFYPSPSFSRGGRGGGRGTFVPPPPPTPHITHHVHKTQLEREDEPAFEVIVELMDRNRWRIYRNVGAVVDALLRGESPTIEERWVTDDGSAFARFTPLSHAKDQSMMSRVEMFRDLHKF